MSPRQDPDILYLDRRIAQIQLALGAVLLLIGVLLGFDRMFGRVLTGAGLLCLGIGLYWLRKRVAVLHDDHVMIGTRRFDYVQITAIDHGHEPIRQTRTSTARVQPYLLIHLDGATEPVRVNIGALQRGAASLQEKIMARVTRARRDAKTAAWIAEWED